MITDPIVNEEELTLHQAVRQGDLNAFTTLVERYQRLVFQICYRMLGDAGEAEEAAQETFLRAYRALERYDPERKFSTWLLSIANHYCIDQLRKRRLLLSSLDEQDGWELPDGRPGPEGSALERERREQVRSLLNCLKEKDRAMIVMRYWQDLSYEEIAEALGLTASAVKSRLHRARRSLAHTWGALEQDPLQKRRQPYEAPTI